LLKLQLPIYKCRGFSTNPPFFAKQTQYFLVFGPKTTICKFESQFKPNLNPIKANFEPIFIKSNPIQSQTWSIYNDYNDEMKIKVKIVSHIYENFQSGSLAIDGLSNPHVCYYDALNDVLKYAVKDGNSWTIEVVDGDIGDVPTSVWGSASLALDGNDVPHISYIDFTPQPVLKYANRPSEGWGTPQVVDNTAYIDQQTSIAVDSNDNIHICYNHNIAGRTFLKHIVGTVGGWQFVDAITDFNRTESPAYLSLACNGDNEPHVCYPAPSLMKVEYAVPLICGGPDHPGDADKNCRVDFFDFSLLAQYWFETSCVLPEYCDGADLNTSGTVDNNDLELLANDWLYCSLPDCY
jgi:hypothetical protein